MGNAKRFADLEADNERLRTAIRWALGEAVDDNGEWFGERPEGAGAYWWRRNLRRIANGGILVYDKAKRTIVRRANEQRTMQEENNG